MQGQLSCAAFVVLFTLLVAEAPDHQEYHDCVNACHVCSDRKDECLSFLDGGNADGDVECDVACTKCRPADGAGNPIMPDATSGCLWYTKAFNEDGTLKAECSYYDPNGEGRLMNCVGDSKPTPPPTPWPMAETWPVCKGSGISEIKAVPEDLRNGVISFKEGGWEEMMEVFGLWLFRHKSVERWTLIFACSVWATYLDPNMDGVPEDQEVVDKIKRLQGKTWGELEEAGEEFDRGCYDCDKSKDCILSWNLAERRWAFPNGVDCGQCHEYCWSKVGQGVYLDRQEELVSGPYKDSFVGLARPYSDTAWNVHANIQSTISGESFASGYYASALEEFHHDVLKGLELAYPHIWTDAAQDNPDGLYQAAVQVQGDCQWASLCAQRCDEQGKCDDDHEQVENCDRDWICEPPVEEWDSVEGRMKKFGRTTCTMNPETTCVGANGYGGCGAPGEISPCAGETFWEAWAMYHNVKLSSCEDGYGFTIPGCNSDAFRTNSLTQKMYALVDNLKLATTVPNGVYEGGDEIPPPPPSPQPTPPTPPVVDIKCGDVKKAYRMEECCHNPHKLFKMELLKKEAGGMEEGGMGRRLKQGDDVLGELSQQLREAERAGGKADAQILARKIKGLLKPYEDV